jgi:hypothetical protein
MITKIHFRNILTIFGLSVALTIFITRPGFAQDTTKTKGDKRVRIVAKIITDKNGKTNEFDTTLNLDRNLKPGEEKELMKGFEMRFKDLGEQMKDLEVEMNEVRLPDTGMMDSIQQLTERAMKHQGDLRKFHFRRNFSPRAFNFDYYFDMPDLAEPQQHFLREFNEENSEGMSEGKGGSLNDLLGDIPMDKVKSYSIKDTKDGKRIVIELNNEPLIEHRREVIILRSPRPDGRHGQGPRHQMKKRMIIKNEE